MRTKTNGTLQRVRNVKSIEVQGPNWLLIAGGALVGTLSIRIGSKLMKAFQTKQSNSNNSNKENGIPSPRRKLGECHLRSNVYCFTQVEDGWHNCESAFTGNSVQTKTRQVTKEADVSLPIVKVPASESIKGNGVMWESSPDRLELQPKPFHHSNSSDSPCFSESGSDIYTKREVIQRLRQQLKRRDEMILEMQEQIANLQSSLSVQMTHSANLQSQIDSVTRDLFDSQREIQQLQKVIANHCVAEAGSPERLINVRNWSPGSMNGHMNGYQNNHAVDVGVEKGRGDEERVEMLKQEVGELKEVIEGKDFLIQNYKEHKVELSSKIKELQLRLNSQVPSIL